MLFKCSQALNTGQIDSHCFRHILQIVHEYTQMNYLELRTSDDWRLCEGTASGSIPMQNLPVLMQDTLYGELRWQSETDSVPLPLMRSVATMLGRGLYFNQAQKHYQQLLLMEERATIARELHDSIAQSLSCMKMQVSCLQMQDAQMPDSNKQLLSQIRNELNTSWVQLRELLTTFRLQLTEPGLRPALEASCQEFSARLGFPVKLDYQLPPRFVPSHQAIHLLQIAREALSNVLKHA